MYTPNKKDYFQSVLKKMKTFMKYGYQIITVKKKQIPNYILECNSNDEEQSQIWHRRLAHFNIDKLINKLPKVNMKTKCKICAKSKLNRPFPPASNKTKNSFELIHMDLVGPITESLYGNKYILTILDDYTRFNWAYFMPNKSDTYDCFITWYNKIKNIYNKNIKSIRTDNGTEFLKSSFKNFCNNRGIDHQTTVPYNPQQNGRAERLNGVLISSATALLEDAKLSRRFWEDAIGTASYVYNRIPHQAINNSILYERLNNTPVDFNNIRVFGCKVLYLIPKRLKYKFLGYCKNPTAFKIFDINNNKIIISRVVEFFENEPANFYFTKQIHNTYNDDIKHYQKLNPIIFNHNPNNISKDNTTPITSINILRMILI